MYGNYILLTAAKNEELYISKAIESVLRQSILPLAWFIMDDGSVDQTREIVQSYTDTYAFIRLYSTNNIGKRSFGSKDRAINAAYELARQLEFDFIGVQDADIAPEEINYYEKILCKFGGNIKLGIAGGYIYERSKSGWACRKSNSPDSVAGGIQMFRRSCYEQIGGYIPMHFGGEDWLAQVDAKIAGWEVIACPELPVFHYRPTSSSDGRWRGLFRLGMMDASFGSHPFFEFFKCARRIAESPVLIGSAIRFCGYVWWNVSGRSPLLQPEKIVYLRKEQLSKISHWWKKLIVSS
ncbi:glycosyltransferase [Methylomicrobium lacus]|uniref:glycosyltransferase n=1 Tax=Methylomicrobium lacus TaxID=136992 RepID=UPI00045E7FA4|nr:glycosyltransferase [Methylomicrobium lacus]